MVVDSPSVKSNRQKDGRVQQAATERVFPALQAKIFQATLIHRCWHYFGADEGRPRADKREARAAAVAPTAEAVVAQLNATAAAAARSSCPLVWSGADPRKNPAAILTEEIWIPRQWSSLSDEYATNT
jgi:hypothetical protein